MRWPWQRDKEMRGGNAAAVTWEQAFDAYVQCYVAVLGMITPVMFSLLQINLQGRSPAEIMRAIQKIKRAAASGKDKSGLASMFMKFANGEEI